MPRKTRCDPRPVLTLTASWRLAAEEVVDDQVDQLDPDEWGDDPAQAVDPQVAAQQRARADRTVAQALQRERDQHWDHDRIEDDRGEDRGVRVAETHNVEH